MGNRRRSDGAGRAASRGARGIFGNAAQELFRLSKNNGKRIDFLPPTKKARDRAKNYHLNRPGGKRLPHVKSTKLKDPDSSDLVHATRSARRRNSDDSARNYAAYRYIDKNGNEGILVGKSQGTHSERSAGAFLLEEMKKGNIKSVTEVFSERAPCAPKKGTCDEWLYEHFQRQNPDFRSSHVWDYDGTDGTNAQVSDKIKAYARGLLGK